MGWGGGNEYRHEQVILMTILNKVDTSNLHLATLLFPRATEGLIGRCGLPALGMATAAARAASPSPASV